MFLPGMRAGERKKTRRNMLEERQEERSVTKDKCVHRLEGVAGRRSVLTPR